MRQNSNEGAAACEYAKVRLAWRAVSASHPPILDWRMVCEWAGPTLLNVVIDWRGFRRGLSLFSNLSQHLSTVYLTVSCVLLHMHCTAYAAPASSAFVPKPEVGTRMGLEVETATKIPAKVAAKREGEGKKKKKSSLAFLQPQPHKQMTKTRDDW
jgi:hypothetical protein